MRTIRCSEQYTLLVEQLGDKAHGPEGAQQKIFPTYMRLMMFAAAIGYDQGQFERVDKGRDLVEGRVIERNNDCLDFIYLLGLAAKKDPMILKEDRQNELADLLEGYVGGGLKLLEEWLARNAEDAYGSRAIINEMYSHGYIPRKHVSSGEEPSF